MRRLRKGLIVGAIVISSSVTRHPGKSLCVPDASKLGYLSYMPVATTGIMIFNVNSWRCLLFYTRYESCGIAKLTLKSSSLAFAMIPDGFFMLFFVVERVVESVMLTIQLLVGRSVSERSFTFTVELWLKIPNRFQLACCNR